MVAAGNHIRVAPRGRLAHPLAQGNNRLGVPILRKIAYAGDSTMTGANRRTDLMITAIKVMHLGIFLTIAAAIFHILFAGIRGRPSHWTGPALGVALGESALFALNGFRCPLTEMVRDRTGASVRVTDIFLPRWFADRIPFIFTPPLVVGIIGLVRVKWMRERSRRSEASASVSFAPARATYPMGRVKRTTPAGVGRIPLRAYPLTQPHQRWCHAEYSRRFNRGMRGANALPPYPLRRDRSPGVGPRARPVSDPRPLA
jgi:hypothetical protein